MCPRPVGRIAFLKPNSFDSPRLWSLSPNSFVKRAIASSRSRTTTDSSITSPSMDTSSGYRCYTTRGYNRWMRVILASLLVAVVLPLAGTHAAEPPVLATTLDNGLRVLLLEDHRSPIVSFQVWYRVGSRNEHRGATGIAHFLEHLMFKGTPTHGL